MEEKCKLIIERPSGYAPLAVYGVEIDGASVGKLKANSTLNVDVFTGRHDLVFTQMGKVKKAIRINIPEGESLAKVIFKLNMLNGKVELRLQNAASEADSVPAGGGVNVNVKQVNYGGMGCLFFAVIVFLAVIINSFPTSDTGTTIDKSKYENMSSEKAAAEMLKDATQEFDGGNYLSALELCGEITNKYPDSREAADMNNYKNEQFGKYIHIGADALLSEYEANVVNADEKYTDKAIVVSGTVSSISKNDGGNNLLVLLKSSDLLSCVQLNFGKDSTEAVASLREGSTITVLGTCKGKSGKQLVIFDGLNVMITKCVMLN